MDTEQNKPDIQEALEQCALYRESMRSLKALATIHELEQKTNRLRKRLKFARKELRDTEAMLDLLWHYMTEKKLTQDFAKFIHYPEKVEE